MELSWLMTYAKQHEVEKLKKERSGESKSACYDSGIQGTRGGCFQQDTQISKPRVNKCSKVRFYNDRVPNTKVHGGNIRPTLPRFLKCASHLAGKCLRYSNDCFSCGKVGNKLVDCTYAQKKGSDFHPQGNGAYGFQKTQGGQQGGAP